MTTLKLRRDTSAAWTTKNPVLAQGEPAIELDTGKLRIGDGSTPFVDLPAYFNEAGLPTTQGEDWREIASSGQPAFANSWVNHDAAWGSTNTQKAGFRKLANGDVELRGTIKSGSMNQTAFQLPVGYRPTKTQVWSVASHSGGSYQVAAVMIDGYTGNVYPTAGSNNALWLDGIRFTPAT